MTALCLQPEKYRTYLKGYFPILALAIMLGATDGHASEMGLPSVDITAKTGAIDAGAASTSRTPNQVTMGVYDPHSMVKGSDDFQIEHVFVAWQAPDKRALDRKIKSAIRDDRALMISVEPFTHAADWREGGDRLFQDIEDGRFDSEIEWICNTVRDIHRPVYMRWGHEMEDVDGRYPWARNDPEGYRKAFAHFVSRCRTILPEARYVWSPKGHKNLAAYYPGDEFVDIIGIPIWGLEKMDIDYWNRPRRFSETVEEKYERVGQFRKPVMIAELGVSGSRTYKQDWYAEIFNSPEYKTQFPLLETILFFNDKEPYRWPMGYGSPDWRFDPKTLAVLVQR
jgi:endoglucanase